MAAISYLYPVSGAVPSQKASSTVTRITAQVVLGVTDTSVVVTHNFNASASDQTNGWPEPRIYYQPGGAPTSTAGFLTFAPATNILTIAMAGGTGSGQTFLLTIERPHTIVR